jgi:hypothetical protein
MNKILKSNLACLTSLLAGWLLMMIVLMNGAEFARYIIENGLPITFWEYSREGMHLLFMVLFTYWTVEVLKWGYKYGK